MIIRVSCAACVAWALGLPASAMDSRFIGTWKMNNAKSKLEGSGLEGVTARARLEQDGPGFKGSVETLTPQGQSTSYAYPLTLDGKPVKVTGAAPFDEVISRRVNQRVFDVVTKKNGRLYYSDRRALSEDGRTITITHKGTNPQGQPYTAIVVFDKQ
jgi:hypothetical protein